MKLDTLYGLLFIVLACLWGSAGYAAFLVDPTGGNALWSDKTGADDEVKAGRVFTEQEAQRAQRY